MRSGGDPSEASNGDRIQTERQLRSEEVASVLIPHISINPVPMMNSIDERLVLSIGAGVIFDERQRVQ